MIVLQAAKMAKEGASKDQIIENVRDMIKRTDIILTVDNLEYLKRGGRLSPSKAMIGNILNIKPILSVDNGEINLYDKVRGSNRVIPKMIEVMKKRSGTEIFDKVCVVHGNSLETAEQLKEEIIRNFKINEIFIQQFGITIGAHTGPGTIGVAYIKKSDKIN
jgi:DegV family protein with EDD domain